MNRCNSRASLSSLESDTKARASIFLSYGRKDADRVTQLHTRLASEGYAAWIDADDLFGACDWSAEIATAIDSCQVLILAISSESMNSENVWREVHYAVCANKPVLPLYLSR